MSPRAGLPLLWLIAAVAALAGTYIAVLPLIPIDETRYAGVALEMWQRGDFLVPRINGELYADKPPLLFWLAHTGWALFGVHGWWLRAVPAIFSLATAGLTAWIACLLWPRQRTVAALAPVLLLGSLLWTAWTPAVMFDIVLSFFSTLAIAGIVLLGTGRHRPGSVLLALGIGLGALTKGPVVLLAVLPAGLLTPLWHRTPGTGRWQWYGRLGAGLLGAVLIASLWVAPAAVRGGAGYTRAILWHQSADRMVDSFAHAQPWWWYLAVIPVALFPWLWWRPVWRGIRMLDAGRDRGVALLLTWLVPALVGFSLVSGKQEHYLLPLFPGAALLLARALALQAERRPSRWDAAPIAAVLLTAAVLIAWIPREQARMDWPAWVAGVPTWLAVAFGLLGTLALFPPDRLVHRTVLLATIAVVTVVTGVAGVSRPAAPWYDLADVARVLHTAQTEGHPVAHAGKYHNRFRFVGRLEQTVAVVGRNELPVWACGHPDGLVVRYFERREDLPRRPVALIERPFRGDWMQVVLARDLLEEGSPTPSKSCDRQPRHAGVEDHAGRDPAEDRG